MSKHKHGFSRAIVERNEAQFTQATKRALDRLEVAKLAPRLVEAFEARRVKGVTS